MKRLLFIALSAAAFSCSGPTDGLTDEERSVVHSLWLHTTPADPSNRFFHDGDAGFLGQMLFFDPRISGPLALSQNTQTSKLGDGVSMAPGQLSCADCHSPDHYFSDDRSTPNNVSFGSAGWTTRNSPALVNVGFYSAPPGKQWFAWDGRSDSLWMQCAVAYEAGKAMGGDRLRLARVLASTDAYRERVRGMDPVAGALLDDPTLFPDDGGTSGCYQNADGGFGPCADQLQRVVAVTSKAWAAYLAQLRSLDSPFDTFAAGDPEALDQQQLRGLKLFLGQAGCITCHSGPFFTDRQFHNTGLVQGHGITGVPDIDNGRSDAFALLRASPYNLLGAWSDLDPGGIRSQLVDTGYPGGPAPENVGQFRTKSLRSVAQTAPFMHAGQLDTLKDVVEFYNAGGNPSGVNGTKDILMQPLGLSPDDIDDLVAFLGSLTGKPVDSMLSCDPSPRFAGGAPHRFKACPP
ncbi:MAG: cytochrome c peroxidase [Myxococcaceae bacterium]